MIPTTISADTRAVADLLLTIPAGELVTPGRVSEVLGRDVTTCRHILYSAMKLARVETGAIFALERGAGYRRLTVEQAAGIIGPAARARVRRTARRAIRTLHEGTMRANDLPPEVQRKLATEVSALGLLEHLARDKAVDAGEHAPMRPEPVGVTARRMLSAVVGRGVA